MAEEEKKLKPAEFPQGLSAESLLLPRSYGGNTSAGKTTWPELVGMLGEEAERKIKAEIGGVNVHIIPQDSFVTMDYNTNRVRIFVDSSAKVAKPPKIG